MGTNFHPSGLLRPYSCCTIVLQAWVIGEGIVRKYNVELQIYVDGVLKNTPAESQGDVSDGLPETIGAGFQQATEYINGLLDDVRIYNRALSADEIKRLYNMGGTVKLNSSQNLNNNNSLQKGLVGWWTFDGKDISGVQTYDRSGNGNCGILTSGPVQTIGKIGQALQFDGVDDYIDISSNIAPTAVTLSAWVKANSFPHSYNVVISKIPSSSSFHRLLVTSSGKLNLWAAGIGAISYDGTGIYTLATNTWYHLVLTYDSVGGLKGYVNGNVDNSVSANGALNVQSGNTSIGEDLRTTSRHFDGLSFPKTGSYEHP
jgi:hypothetical protein